MESKTKLTRERVIEIVGRIDDGKIADIIATSATADELLEAYAGAVEQGDLEAETRRRMSGRVAEVYDILMAGEPKWPAAEDSPD